MKLDTSTDPQTGFRPPGPLGDAQSALARYDGRFSMRNAAHLLRRAGFGSTPSDVTALTSLGVDRAVDSFLHPVGPAVDFPAYPPTDILFDQKKNRHATQLWFLDQLVRTNQPLVQKMMLFWHGHFATSMQKVPPQLMAQQMDLFRAQGLGKFPSLLASVSKDPAMLVWLDNRGNSKAHPNENYAREVMELFALGLGNYTEDDVKEAARSFTGWTLDKSLAFLDNPKLHDDTPKTVLGKTGNWNGNDVVNIIVQQPAHSRFMAHKLLEFFVYSDPEPELIEALASVYAISGYDIPKTVGTIFRSNVFYSSRAYRAIPKSPIEFAVGTLRYMGVTTVPDNLPFVLARMGQDPLDPPSVKGWDGGPTWINTATLLARFNFVNALIATSIQRKTATPMSMPAPVAVAATISPDAIVGQAGGFDAQKVVSTVVNAALQDDVTSDVRSTLVSFVNSTNTRAAVATAMTTVAPVATAASAPPPGNPLPFGPENYQDKIRGVIALTLNLPVNQLN